MTFKVCNHGSKWPYLLFKMGFVDPQFGTTVCNASILPLHVQNHCCRLESNVAAAAERERESTQVSIISVL